MHLKTLTVRGFKSFASATTFEFEPGVTAVVGPNGSGKSNVVDALSWVMGEQGAKTLRGGKMEDVIFAGTSGRAPLGRAHVSLTIDNTDGQLPIDYAEVTISRTLFRAGGSEYAINGSSCRLLDIQELLSDSGLGREMHVIVGQGQLDRILHATAEDRRGFIEEAAGVLKHRRRKEKTLRKLQAMQGNLDRLEDLSSEVRRQLAPLGRQAKIARRAKTVQLDVRDAKSRLLADDLVTLNNKLAQDIDDESRIQAQQDDANARLERGRKHLAELISKLELLSPRLGTVQEAWVSLSTQAERFRSLSALARERGKLLQSNETHFDSSRDPQRLEAQAERMSEELEELEEALEDRHEILAEAVEAKEQAEEASRAEQQRMATMLRAAADRREGMSRLASQVASARSRVDVTRAEIGRLQENAQTFDSDVELDQRSYIQISADLETHMGAEAQLNSAFESAENAFSVLDTAQRNDNQRERELSVRVSGLSARLEALKLNSKPNDQSAKLLESTSAQLMGRLGELLTVRAGYEQAVASILRDNAEALVAENTSTALNLVAQLHSEQASAIFLHTDIQAPLNAMPVIPDAVFAREVVSAPAELDALLERLFSGQYIVEDLGQLQAILDQYPSAQLTTLEGISVSAARSAVGDSASASLIAQQALVEQTTAELQSCREELGAIESQLAQRGPQLSIAQQARDEAAFALNESDATIEELSSYLARLGEKLRTTQASKQKLLLKLETLNEKFEIEQESLEEITERMELASTEQDDETVDDAGRAVLVDAAASARQQELEARLSLRSSEERAVALRSRIEGLRRTAAAERNHREVAARLAEQRKAQAANANRVEQAAERVLRFIEVSTSMASQERDELSVKKTELESMIGSQRTEAEQLSAELTRLADAVHRDEMARAELRMRIENLETKALEELGYTPDHLIAHFGPDQLIPEALDEDDKWGSLRQNVDEDGNPIGTKPYDRGEQEKRLKKAEKDLSALGKVNPLALEEFAALEERHKFLSGQLEDLKKSRSDLQQIIVDVDSHVERVFTEAYEDTAVQFKRIFERLFPGGEGQLVLTDPGNMLATGIEVEARPAGKKIKRLSLLSGGERSLTAVALLVAIFKARPSPFYVMDEVEAALDDMNLGRLITIFEELRESSQLIVITHQKKTMEVADALYGVTMRGDGVSTVIGQKMDRAPAE
ncbi:MAG TPA: chromosome segregation protein SMC [Glutamicibacter sp.]|uniref:Chromosome partition protein Smc n=1 Tax=Glutamicibacter arilaitensis (strain DSM 16368 / CIP 108037 / IAM 15318 / JCM 13566 / NCIMB 14258 / Re117) TaxID=861360 RepID=A0ABM9PWS2_GLUAR|nr:MULTISPECIES: chromosome segregation protein SMC [Glutamicibacter]CBT75685.1 chromosome segregation protein Smc [Glutamicibacter arilaitensis Re117]HCH48202.1 chromosome segregation protein SMC [Glutamicibacter sp.]